MAEAPREMNGRGMPVSAEQEILKACARGVSADERRSQIQQLLERRLDWRLLVQLAQRHGVVACLYYYLKPLTPELPANALGELREHALRSASHGLFLESELMAFTDLLTRHGISFVPIKGPSLASRLYESPAMRRSGDLDILLHREDLRRVIELSREIGYRPPDNYSPQVEKLILEGSNHYHIRRPDNKSLIELHWDWLPTGFRLPIVERGLWSRVAAIEWNGGSLPFLSLEDLTVLLCIHGTKHRWGLLKWTADVSRLLYLEAKDGSGLHSIDWDLVLRLTEHHDLRRMLAVGLLSVEKILGPPLPSSLRTVLTEDRRAVQLSEFIAARPLDSLGKPSGIRETFFRLHFRQDPAEKLRYLSRVILAPTPIEMETASLPAGFRWAYPFLRFIRLSFKYLQPRNWRRSA